MSGPFGSGTFGTQVFGNAPLYNTSTLIDAVLRASGHANPANETNKRVAVLGFLNNCYATVSASRHWDWLFQTLDSAFEAPYSDGTVAINAGSQAVVGTGTAFDANVVPNNVLLIPSLTESYVIDDVTSAAALTLQGKFAGDDATGLSYQIVKSILTMPGDLEHVQSILVDGVGKLVPLGRQEFKLKQSYNPTYVGPPRWFTEIGRRAADGVRQIEVYPSPDKRYSIQLCYGVNIMVLEDDEASYPLVPDRYRQILYYGALAEMYRFLSDPVRSNDAKNDFNAALNLMKNDTQLTDSRYTLQPSRNYKNRRGDRRYRVFMDRTDFGREDY